MAASNASSCDSHEAIRTVAFVSLGCPKNLVDSEKMLGLLAESGITPVPWEAQESERWDDAAHVEGESSAPVSDAEVDESQTLPSADAIVINTCGFLEASKDESLAVIKQAVAAKERGRLKRVVVAGCLVQRHRARMIQWEPGIDAMIGVFDRDHIVDAVTGQTPEREALADSEHGPKYWVSANALSAAADRGIQTTGLTVQGKDGKGIGYFEDDSARLRLTPRHYAYLRIGEGCNQKCAFCTIPSIRGKMRSKPRARIADEAQELVRDGAFEINLIGQDTTSYGDDIGLGFDQGWALADPGGLFGRGGLPDLLKDVCESVEKAHGASGMGWVRLMYAYPSNFRSEFIEAFAEMCEQSVLVPYIDIPLQHATDHMLEKMRRHVSATQQAELMCELREKIPGLAIRTTLITGFPGETEQDHDALLAFVEEIGFEALGVFEYSAEPGTPAGTLEQDMKLAVPARIKAQRKGELMALQQEIAFEQAEYLAGQFDAEDPLKTGVRFDVLIDQGLASDAAPNDENSRFLQQGRCYFQAPQVDAVTFVRSRTPKASGELVRCVVVGWQDYDLIAVPVDELESRVSLPIV